MPVARLPVVVKDARCPVSFLVPGGCLDVLAGLPPFRLVSGLGPVPLPVVERPAYRRSVLGVCFVPLSPATGG